MAIELVTGKAGVGHVSSADLGRLQAGICGADRYVLSTGGRFPYIIESANQISIGSGDAVDQGRHVVIPTNSSESVGIQNGNAGKVRIDLIAIQYNRDTASPNGIETALWCSKVQRLRRDQHPRRRHPRPATSSAELLWTRCLCTKSLSLHRVSVQ